MLISNNVEQLKPILITVPITTPKEFEFDIAPVLKLIKDANIADIINEQEMDEAIDECISKEIAGYDDIFYYSFHENEYKLVRNEIKKYLITQLNLGI